MNSINEANIRDTRLLRTKIDLPELVCRELDPNTFICVPYSSPIE